MTNSILLVAGGLVLLALGGELLVRGSVGMAARLGISPLLAGLVIVGFGTSMPELATSVQAALDGAPGIALGNVVGSNIANMLLILGISALVCADRGQRGLVPAGFDCHGRRRPARDRGGTAGGDLACCPALVAGGGAGRLSVVGLQVRKRVA